MGSEMCIRDRSVAVLLSVAGLDSALAKDSVPFGVSVNPLLVFILFIASDVDIVSETALLICST